MPWTFLAKSAPLVVLHPTTHPSPYATMVFYFTLWTRPPPATDATLDLTFHLGTGSSSAPSHPSLNYYIQHMCAPYSCSHSRNKSRPIVTLLYIFHRIHMKPLQEMFFIFVLLLQHVLHWNFLVHPPTKVTPKAPIWLLSLA